MARMSDILKRVKEKRAKTRGRETSAEPSREPPRIQPTKPPPPQEELVKPKEPPTVFKAEKSSLLSKEESTKLYKDTIALVRDIYDKVKADQEITLEDKDIIGYVERFVDQQYLGNDIILDLLNLPMEDNFLYNHVVNVCIISIEIGLGLKYERPKLVELGVTAILHDIGMAKFYDLYSQPRQLSKKESNKLRSHTAISAEILEKFRNIYKKSVSVVYQEHERVNGSGYPRGLKTDDIDEYAKILGLADVYEAMSHWRPHRAKFYPLEVLKRIIDAKSSFGRKILKILIERITPPYPIGSYVKLSSGERGKVSGRNLGCSLRPIIEVIYGADGERLERPNIIDLIKYPTIYIKSHLKDEEM